MVESRSNVDGAEQRGPEFDWGWDKTPWRGIDQLWDS